MVYTKMPVPIFFCTPCFSIGRLCPTGSSTANMSPGRKAHNHTQIPLLGSEPAQCGKHGELYLWERGREMESKHLNIPITSDVCFASNCDLRFWSCCCCVFEPVCICSHHWQISDLIHGERTPPFFLELLQISYALQENCSSDCELFI